MRACVKTNNPITDRSSSVIHVKLAMCPSYRNVLRSERTAHGFTPQVSEPISNVSIGWPQTYTNLTWWTISWDGNLSLDQEKENKIIIFIPLVAVAREMLCTDEAMVFAQLREQKLGEGGLLLGYHGYAAIPMLFSLDAIWACVFSDHPPQISGCC